MSLRLGKRSICADFVSKKGTGPTENDKRSGFEGPFAWSDARNDARRASEALWLGGNGADDPDQLFQQSALQDFQSEVPAPYSLGTRESRRPFSVLHKESIPEQDAKQMSEQIRQ